jgi:hypothetical protein
MLAAGTFCGLAVSMLASGTFCGVAVSMLVSGTFGGLAVSMLASGTFGGLVVSMLASGTQVRGFKHGRSHRIFQGEKIFSIPSFGREVKPFAPCRSFTACETTHNYRESRNFMAKFIGHFSSIVPPFAARIVSRLLHAERAWR